MIQVELANPQELEKLMSSEAYEAFLKEQEE
jgi:hypothetical protein